MRSAGSGSCCVCTCTIHMWPSPLPFTLSQVTLPFPQVSLVPNGDTMEAKWLKDLQDLQEKELLKKYQLTESMKNIFW